MRIFISWSGTRSEWVANALRDWLPSVIQSLRPFISTRDISKGSRGGTKIAQELEDAKIGIICLTEENLAAPWILFEAGALSKIAAAHVCTLLYQLDNSDVPSPLGQFQHTKAEKDEIAALLRTINDQLGELALDSQRLDEAFEIWWPKLEQKLLLTPARPNSEPVPDKPSSEDKLNELLEMVRAMQKSKPPLVKNVPRLGSYWVENRVLKGPFFVESGELSHNGNRLFREIISSTALSQFEAIDFLKNSVAIGLGETSIAFRSKDGVTRSISRIGIPNAQLDASSSASDSASSDT